MSDGKNSLKRFRSLGGFTLVEILIVIGIVGLIAAGIVASLSPGRQRARDTKRVADMRQLRTALDLYYNDNLRYPVTLDSLAPEYIAQAPRDPFGQPYRYAARGTDSICGSYHLGANLEDETNAALGQDVDAEAAAKCSGSEDDFSGKDVVTCGGSAGADACYDIVPEILALMEAGIPPPLEAAPPGVPPPLAAAGATESYRFSGGGTPVFISADIQPRDVSVGDIQRLSVEVEDSVGVLDVIAATELDHSVKVLALEPLDGAKSGCTRCRWETTWVVNDTSLKTYHTVFTAQNLDRQKNSVTLAWTDPCSPSLGGDWTLDDNCTNLTGVNGVDNGDFVVASGFTMTIPAGAVWAINKGKSISFKGGAIAFGGSAEIQRTNVWILDADNDGYGSSTSYQLAQDTQPTNYRRRNTATAGTDVNDSNATVYQSIACYRDDDADTYTTGGAVNVSCGASCGTGCTNFKAAASASDDCYDANANAKPGQTSYFTTSRGDGSFDYDCNSTADQEFTATNSCP